MTLGYGIKLRLDKGKEWSLVIFIQDYMATHRHNTAVSPSVSGSSRNVSYSVQHYFTTVMTSSFSNGKNHTIERVWVEVNSRVNYPLKRILINMSESGEIDIDNSLHKFCTSWFVMQVANFGMQQFVAAWNSHPLPG